VAVRLKNLLGLLVEGVVTGVTTSSSLPPHAPKRPEIKATTAREIIDFFKASSKS